MIGSWWFSSPVVVDMLLIVVKNVTSRCGEGGRFIQFSCWKMVFPSSWNSYSPRDRGFYKFLSIIAVSKDGNLETLVNNYAGLGNSQVRARLVGSAIWGLGNAGNVDNWFGPYY